MRRPVGALLPCKTCRHSEGNSPGESVAQEDGSFKDKYTTERLARALDMLRRIAEMDGAAESCPSLAEQSLRILLGPASERDGDDVWDGLGVQYHRDVPIDWLVQWHAPGELSAWRRAMQRGIRHGSK